MHASRDEVRSENVGTAELGEITTMTFDKEKEGGMRQPDMESGGSQSPTSGGMSQPGGSGSESGTDDMSTGGGWGQPGGQSDDMGQSGDVGQTGGSDELEGKKEGEQGVTGG